MFCLIVIQVSDTESCDTLTESYSDLGLRPRDILRLVYGNRLHPDELHKQPLAKFTMDILR